MPIFECDCGLIVSTSSDCAQCLRCRQQLGQPNRLRRVNPGGIDDTVVISIRTERVIVSASRVANDVRSAAQNRTDG
jgi:hypothetical protein